MTSHETDPGATDPGATDVPLPPEGVADDGATEDEPVPRGGATAADRGWGPAPTPSSSITGVTVGGVTVHVHRDVAALVRAGMEGMAAAGYHPRAGECWGYAPRRIRPSTGKTESQMPWSNHAWGLAVDINAPANPMGATLVTDMSDAAVQAFTSLGFRWGGTYQSRPDAMHFEYLGTRAAASSSGGGSGGGSSGGTGGTSTTATTTEPGRLIVDVSLPLLRQGGEGTQVSALQALLNVKAGAGLTVDGDFGPATEGAVRAWQAGAGLDADGIVGQASWKALLEAG